MSTGLLWRALCLLTILCTVSHHVCCIANQPDPSGTEQGLTFSHIYKIDVPGSSSCTVEHLPSHETGLQQDTTTSGENDIVFKHNIRLQPPKCNCEESESFKNLLYRINGLEEEVNYLKTQCTQGCCGRGGATVIMVHISTTPAAASVTQDGKALIALCPPAPMSAVTTADA
ncbi:hypothetical protein XENORESO_007008 [Xenotaenia resolanae]|uniref:Uncharacterized protein n=1 Tax=Xenotaenia resolanae TaxID=208358 RepID=A0ABV0W7K9_9TELE